MSDDIEQMLADLEDSPKSPKQPKKPKEKGFGHKIKWFFLKWAVFPVSGLAIAAGGVNGYLYHKNAKNYEDYSKHLIGDWLKGKYPKIFDFFYEDDVYTYPDVPLKQASLYKMEVPEYVDDRLKPTVAKHAQLEYDMLRMFGAQESGFRATVRNEFSGACGMMQLLASTQLELMYKHGEKYGYHDRLSKHIKRITREDDTFQYTVDEDLRETVLAICTDAMFSAQMGAEYAIENIEKLHKDFPGRYVNYTDVYMYHFYGAGGGKKFLTNLEATPDRAVKEDYPDHVVKANMATFFKDGGEGEARSYAEIYEYYANKISTQIIQQDKEAHDSHYSFISFLKRAFEEKEGQENDAKKPSAESAVQPQGTKPKV